MRTQLRSIAVALALGAAVLLAAAPASAITTRYDFSSGSHSAYDGEVDQTDANIASANFPAGRTNWGADWLNWAEATVAEYTALTSSDDSYYRTVDHAGWGDNVAHRFEFTVAEDPADITDILLSVEVSRARNTDAQFFYLWNYTDSQYTVLGSIATGTTDVAVTDYSLVDNVAGIDATNIGEYVDASGQMTLLSINQDVRYFSGSRWQQFDYIQTAIVWVPEPESSILLALGLLGLAVQGSRRPRTR
jgi:hypothetical protein